MIESLAAVIRSDGPDSNHFFDGVFFWLSYAAPFTARNVPDCANLKILRSFGVDLNLTMTIRMQT